MGNIIMKKSTYQNFIELNPDIKTAIIYSVDHLFAYTVEIKEGNSSYYIADKKGPLMFGNMEDARQAAIKENVKVAYLALSKTYEEPDISTCHADHQDRYDYSPIILDSKNQHT